MKISNHYQKPFGSLHEAFCSRRYLLFISLIIVALMSQSCATMSEGEKLRLEQANLAKENTLCCIEKMYVGSNIIQNRDNELEIVNVIDGSPFGNAGILPGDIIVKLDDEVVKSKYQAWKIYDSKYPGDKALLTVKRKNKIITKTIEYKSFHVFNTTYTLVELVYKDVPIRLAVIPGKVSFDLPEDKKEYERYEAYIIGSLESTFIKNFRGHSNFLIIDRQKTESVLNELKFQESGLVDNKSRGKLGSMLGATHLMVMDFSSSMSVTNKTTLLTLRLIEVESGKNMATSPFKFSSKVTVDIVQRDLLDYLNNKMRRIVYLEKESINLYNSIRHQLYKEESIDTLTNKVIPLYGKFLKELKAIRPNTEELFSIHNIYIEGSTLQYEGLIDLEASIRKNNSRQANEANIKIKEANIKINQYNSGIKRLSDKHKVVLKH